MSDKIEKSVFEGVVFKTPVTRDQMLHGSVEFVTPMGLDLSGLPPDLCDEWDDSHVNDFDLSKTLKPTTKSFVKAKEDMMMVNDFIWKKEIKQGNLKKGLVPRENANVIIRYHSYLEGTPLPFDTSDMRGDYKFTTGYGEVLEGLEEVVLTMCEGEKSWFIVSYQLLFGELGCPPRVPPKADVFYVIEVKQFNAINDVNECIELKAEDENAFEVAFEKAKKLHRDGVCAFQHKDYRIANQKFERALFVLENCHLNDEEDEKQYNAFLIKLHTNLTVGYNLAKQPKKVCIHVKKVRHLTENKLPCKVLFQEGRALFALGSFGSARAKLNSALKMEPQNKEILAELKKLNEKFKAYKADERDIWRKALGLKEKIEQSDDTAVPQEPPQPNVAPKGEEEKALGLKEKIEQSDDTAVPQEPSQPNVAPKGEEEKALGLTEKIEQSDDTAVQQEPPQPIVAPKGVEKKHADQDELVASIWELAKKLQELTDEPVPEDVFQTDSYSDAELESEV